MAKDTAASWVERCFALDQNSDLQISDNELSYESDQLKSWTHALELRRACHLLMGDSYFSSMRTTPTLSSHRDADTGYYFINLEKSKDRLEKMTRHFETAGIPYQRIEAVYGKDINLTQLVNDRIYIPGPHPSRFLKAAERGVYLSHLKTWRQAIKDGVRNAVIFEDDVAFPPDLDQQVQQLIQSAPSDWDILYLGCNANYTDSFFEPCWAKNLNPVPGASLNELNDKCIAGAWAYIINAQTAQILARNIFPMEWPIDYILRDAFIGEQKFGRFKAYCASPEIVTPGQSGSVIGDRGNCKTIECNE